MRQVIERSYFRLSLVLGWLLRSGKYAKTQVVHRGGNAQVRKARFFYAPLLLWMGNRLLRLMDTGVQVLPRQEWEARESQLYETLYRTSIWNDHGTVILPYLTGKTLASWLENPHLEEVSRKNAIERAVTALVEFHRLGFTHGDAMAENVLVDLELGVVHWFDFETVHDPSRSMDWRRADDVRAFLVTCWVRTLPPKRAETLHLILDTYADENVTQILAARFASVLNLPLSFHLAQAPLSLQSFREIAELLKKRLNESPLFSRADAIH